MFCRVSHMQVFWQLKRKTINWSSDIKLLKSLRTTTWRLVLFIRRWCCATCVSMKLADFPKENWCARFSEQAATNPSSRQQTLQLSIAASHITHQAKAPPFSIYACSMSHILLWNVHTASPSRLHNNSCNSRAHLVVYWSKFYFWIPLIYGLIDSENVLSLQPLLDVLPWATVTHRNFLLFLQLRTFTQQIAVHADRWTNTHTQVLPLSEVQSQHGRNRIFLWIP